MFGFHPADFAVALLYIVLVCYFGIRGARRASKDQEGFFLAGRKLGKVYQFFLNFGNSTDANGAVSAASLVYQQGVSGVWLGFQMVFLNPYYWFMNVWFRRVRLVTTAELFVDRLGSQSLARFYALFQCLSAVVIIIGFGNLITYKISTALIVKPEATWTAGERASVAAYHELQRYENVLKTTPLAALPADDQSRLAVLRERDAKGELQSTVSPIEPVSFYLVYTLIVGAYVVLGGMAATAANEIIQSLLIVVFSAMLIPVGIHAVGGLEAFTAQVPATMFELLRDDGPSRQITALVLVGILANTLVQINGIAGNMAIYGSAKNEFAARFGGVSGTFAKRLMIIMWAFCGLVAVALYQGPSALADPDEAWGAMSRQLLGPGFLGLMVVGVLAANMSTVAAQSMAVSALFVRSIYQPLRPAATEKESVFAGRVTIAVALILGVVAALSMNDVFLMLQFMLTVNVPFGAAVLLMFFWRRLSVRAVWMAVAVSVLVTTVGPVVLPRLESVRTNAALLERAQDETGRLHPVYFESVVRVDPNDDTSALIGRDRLHLELWMLNLIGMPVEKMSPSNQFAARLLFAALLPFVLLIGISFVTRPPERTRIDAFFGKMKTPVGETPEAEQAAMAATLRDPHRFDHLKLFPNSNWEFTQWNRVDTIGFVACCAISGAIIALFWSLLRLVAP
jgi:Na+/proline symporter